MTMKATTTTTTTSSSSCGDSRVGSSARKRFKGVRMRSWGSWVTEIRAPNQKTRIWLGSYSTPEAAARAYDAALICLKGSSAAALNFPTTSASNPNLFFPCGNDDVPDGTVMSPKSIQRVAAAAAANAGVPPLPPSPPPTPLLSPSPQPLPSPAPSTSSSELTVEEELPVPSLADCLLWDDLDAIFSPKYADQMLGACATVFGSFDLDHQVRDYFDEGGDIRLWDFC